jgi:hypothetical protein
MIGSALCMPDNDNDEVRIRFRVRTLAGHYKSSKEEPTGEVHTEKGVRYNRMILYGLFFVKYLLDRGNIGCPLGCPGLYPNSGSFA